MPRIARLFCLGLLVFGSTAASGAADPPERAWTEALLSTWVHGVDDALAESVLGTEAVPHLRKLLADPAFPRRDNVVAFLGHLDEGSATDDLIAFLSAPPSGWSTPEEDRALLLAPVALGHIARRGDRAALDRLLTMTAPDGDGGPLLRAAAAGPRPRALLSDLLESALRGLAMSGDPRARDRLVDVALDRIRLPGNGRDLSPTALFELELFDELHVAPSSAPDAPGTEGGAPVDLGPGDPTDPPSSPDGFDTHGRVHDGALDYANHVDHNDPIGDTRVDDALAEINLWAGREDFVGDTACCITVSRLGSGTTFGSPGDSLDIINTSGELSAVLDNNVARVKVVRSIQYCGGPGSNIIGCAQVGGDGMSLVRLGTVRAEGILWLHEYGHNVGLGHSGDPRHVMFRSLTGANNGLTQSQCNRYHSPSGGANAVLTDTGACTDDDGDLMQDGFDNCPGVANNGQADGDGDGDGDPCDNCPGVSNPDQTDTDGDSLGDACDDDDDGDGLEDGEDCAPLDPTNAPPGRATGLGWPGPGNGELSWTVAAQTEVSNVYRGTLTPSFNADWACLADDVPGNTATDTEEPDPDEGFHYLVTCENACGESDGGLDGQDDPRMLTPCP